MRIFIKIIKILTYICKNFLSLKVKLFFCGNNTIEGIYMIKFKNLPDSDKPRERLYMYGVRIYLMRN